MKLERKPGSLVELETAYGIRKEFEIEHAERLLRHPDSGWELPKDSKFKFDYYDGITHRTDSGHSTETGAIGHDTQGD